MPMGRDKILIMDDEQPEIGLLKQVFEQEYTIIAAADAKDTITKLVANNNSLVAILLKIEMPGINGMQMLQLLKAKKLAGNTPIIMIGASVDAHTEQTCYTLGASAVISKPYSIPVIKKRIKKIVEIFNNMETLKDDIEKQRELIIEQERRIRKYDDSLMDTIASIIEFRDFNSSSHIKRVKGFTAIIAAEYLRQFPDDGLTKDQADMIVRAASVHDIGKITVPDHILLKPGRLSEDENQLLKSHTTKGGDILNMITKVHDDEQFKITYDVCRFHHEQYDGLGYPDGLKGDKIPLSAQIVGLADTYDSLLSDRLYKTAYDKKTTFKMIVNGEGARFNPKLIKCFKAAIKRLEAFADINQ